LLITGLRAALHLLCSFEQGHTEPEQQLQACPASNCSVIATLHWLYIAQVLDKLEYIGCYLMTKRLQFTILKVPNPKDMIPNSRTHMLNIASNRRGFPNMSNLDYGRKLYVDSIGNTLRLRLSQMGSYQGTC
ncbi:hypothetical protein M8C21_010334, partial [Ambrosia artemisiifolia]